MDLAARCVELPDLVFFDSALEKPEAISLLAAEPTEILTGNAAADWDELREKVLARQRRFTASGGGLPPGIVAGYVEYDGTFRFGIYDSVLLYSHFNQSWRDAGGFAASRDGKNSSLASRPIFCPRISERDFCQRVDRAQEYIAAGDIYQVNLSHRFEAPWHGHPWPFYEALRRCSPAPYGAFLSAGERAILSASPERFLCMTGRKIQTCPIKGTRPRRAAPAADAQSAHELLHSSKEAAELVMITDLERNDLGQVCDYGSIAVRELLQLERFEQVFHLVSTVEGNLREEVDHVTALQKCFPGGSITGAPKKRAQEIIAELEPVPRGLYTGAIGYFGDDGESQFNVAIRTVIIENGLAHFHVGAGIVADSMAAQEYQETLDKAAGILLAAEKIQ